MADTIGDLFDKLSIANIKLWHIEDERREFCGRGEKDAEKAINYLNMISKVNSERNSLIDQINGSLMVIVDKCLKKDSSLNLTYDEIIGNGKNKHYKD